MNKEVICTGCGHLTQINPFWASQQNKLGEESKLKCPVCFQTDKWELIESYIKLGSRDAALDFLRKKYHLPDDLDKKMVIAQNNSKLKQVFQGGKFKIAENYDKILRINSNEEVVQTFNPVTGQDYREGEEPRGTHIDLTKGKETTLSERRKKAHELQKYGVKIVR